jgi:hypothetical protein
MSLPQRRKQVCNFFRKALSAQTIPLLCVDFLPGTIQVPLYILIIGIPNAASAQYFFPFRQVDCPKFSCPLIDILEKEVMYFANPFGRKMMKSAFIKGKHIVPGQLCLRYVQALLISKSQLIDEHTSPLIYIGIIHG